MLQTSTHVLYVPGKDGQGTMLFLRDGNLMAQAFDETRLEPTGSPVRIADGVDAYLDSATMSVSDNGVLVYRTVASLQLRWLDRQGRPAGNVAERGQYMTLALSPNGARALVSKADPQIVSRRELLLFDFLECTTRPRTAASKYNPPHGGPADASATRWIEDRANALLSDSLKRVARVPYEGARRASTTHTHDYVGSYVQELGAVVDMEAIRSARLKIGVDPLGGAGVAYWRPIAERYGVELEVVNDIVDPTFAFMPLDWDGRIRMDCSSPHAMAKLIGLKDRFDIAFGNDTDADRHGIVTRGAGLMKPNQYLAAAIFFLFTHRPGWSLDAAVGKTAVSSSIIDRVAARTGRRLFETPVGFKWFVPGLLDGSLGFGGEESAGASFLRRDGRVWVTDKDGIIMNLLSNSWH